jgi:hypothetical protein
MRIGLCVWLHVCIPGEGHGLHIDNMAKRPVARCPCTSHQMLPTTNKSNHTSAKHAASNASPCVSVLYPAMVNVRWLQPSMVLKAETVVAGQQAKLVYFKQDNSPSGQCLVLVSQVHDVLHNKCPLASCNYDPFRAKLKRALGNNYVALPAGSVELDKLISLGEQLTASSRAAVKVGVHSTASAHSMLQLLYTIHLIHV